LKDESDQKKSVIVMIRGIPGSGKSLIATEIQKEMGKDQVVILDPDATDYKASAYVDFSAQLREQGVDDKLHPYRFLRAKAYEAIMGRKIIVWNQAFTNNDLLNRTIDNLTRYAADNGVESEAFVVEVAIDLSTAKERVKNREKLGGHGVTDEAFNRFVADYVSFEGYDYQTVSVQGSDPVSASAARVLLKIQQLRTA
jgi:predicted ABC-type ATPase